MKELKLLMKIRDGVNLINGSFDVILSLEKDCKYVTFKVVDLYEGNTYSHLVSASDIELSDIEILTGHIINSLNDVIDS